MQRLIMTFAPAVKQEFAGTMACETASREHSSKQKLLYLYFEDNCYIKPMGGQRIRLKPDSVLTKFIFTVENQRGKSPSIEPDTE